MRRSVSGQLNKLLCILMLCMVLLSILAPAALAEPVQKCELIIDYQYETTPVSGASFRLYRIADLDSQYQLNYTGIFSDLQLDTQGLIDAVEDLYTKISDQSVDPELTLITDEQGSALASGIAPGAFLLVGDPLTLGSFIYHVDKQVVFLPAELDQTGEPEYSLTLRPKSSRVPVGTQLTCVKVVKQWDDKGYENQRPRSITVRLLKDGATVSTVKLSASNGWTHTWEDLLPNARWTVKEDVPSGYVVSTEEIDEIFTLTNHRKDIPQTGTIWWPVATILAVGLVLIILGITLRWSGRYGA